MGDNLNIKFGQLDIPRIIGVQITQWGITCPNWPTKLQKGLISSYKFTMPSETNVFISIIDSDYKIPSNIVIQWSRNNSRTNYFCTWLSKLHNGTN